MLFELIVSQEEQVHLQQAVCCLVLEPVQSTDLFPVVHLAGSALSYKVLHFVTLSVRWMAMVLAQGILDKHVFFILEPERADRADLHASGFLCGCLL